MIGIVILYLALVRILDRYGDYSLVDRYFINNAIGIQQNVNYI